MQSQILTFHAVLHLDPFDVSDAAPSATVTVPPRGYTVPSDAEAVTQGYVAPPTAVPKGPTKRRQSISRTSEARTAESNRAYHQPTMAPIQPPVAASQMEQSKKRKRSETGMKPEDIEQANIIERLIVDMKNAYTWDRMLNNNDKPLVHKLALLTRLKYQLHNLPKSFLKLNPFLGLFTQWLGINPDYSLPDVIIRETVLKELLKFRVMDMDTRWVHDSGIESALKYLLQHPKETPENKDLCTQFIDELSRAGKLMINKVNNAQTSSKQPPLKRRLQSVSMEQEFIPLGPRSPGNLPQVSRSGNPTHGSRSRNPLHGSRTGSLPYVSRSAVQQPVRTLQPQELRATFPQQSSKVYLNRPRWNV